MNVVSRLIIGGIGSGKSEGTLTELVRIAQQGEYAIILMDGHGLLADKFMLQLVSNGLSHRVLYDKIADFNRILAGFKLEQSADPNPFKRESENSKRLMGLVDLMWRASQREGDVHAMPTMSQGADYTLRLLMFQPEPVPLSLLPYVFRLKHPIHAHLVSRCTDEETVEYWEAIGKQKNAPAQLEREIGPIKRLSRQTFGMPAFRERCDGHFDIGRALRDRHIIIINGADDGTVSKQSVTAVFGAVSLLVDQFLRRHFALTKTPCPVLLVWEEAAAFRSIGPIEIDMLRELRKTGFAGWVISQDKEFIDPRLWPTLKSCTQERVWYNPYDDELALDAGRSIAIRKLNPDLVKHVTESERVIWDGWESVTHKRVSKSGDRETETQNEIERAKYRKVKDVKTDYFTFDEQIKLEAQKLMTMGKGYRMVERADYVSERPEYIPMLKEPWPAHLFPWNKDGITTLAEKKLLEAIVTSQARPEFKTPVNLAEQWVSTTIPSRENENSGPANLQTFIPLPTSNSSKQGSTRPPRRRGSGSKRPKNAG